MLARCTHDARAALRRCWWPACTCICGLLIINLASGCAAVLPSAAPNQAQPAQLTQAAAEAALPDAGWAWLSSPDRRLRFPLPDALRWRRSSRPGLLTYLHQESRSELQLRLERAPRQNSVSRCLSGFNLQGLGLPAFAPDQLIEAASLQLAKDFAAELFVFMGDENAPPWRGFVLLIAAKPEKCLAAVFRAEREGSAALRELADDLQLAAHRLLPQIELRTAADRVPAPLR
jgi:hypothetical protein